MKKIVFIISLLLFTCFSFHSYAKRMQAFMSYATFYSPKDGPYIETYMIVVGKSVHFTENANKKFQSTIEITLIFRQDSVIKDFKKYNLLSPEVDDTSNVNFNFIDQQRFILPDGTYDVEIIIADKNATSVPFKGNETIDISYPATKVAISGIEVVDSYKRTESENILSKAGYDMVPYILYYYPDNINKMTYYAEIYNTDKVIGTEEKYLLSTYIEINENEKLVDAFVKVKKEVAKPVNVVFGEFDLSALPTGNYNLVVEARDKMNKQIAIQKFYFERDNLKVQAPLQDVTKVVTEHSFVEMYTNKDTLAEYIRCLYPISSENERIFAKNQLNRNELVSMQKFFLAFWQTRNPQSPGEAWGKYLIEVNKVNKEYTTNIKRGYETDRGRVYLEYGEPNTISKQYYEPSAFPYEIWHYYTCKNQKNRKFVFCDNDLATNDFVLIHSDAIGEIYDYKWQQKIYGRNNVTNDIDQDGVRNHFGRKSEELFNNPR
ncbi:MAG: GWxTD domain-containing protein [Bacteroidota bacterium]